MIELKVKLAEGATLPNKANTSDSGYDLVATKVTWNDDNGYLEYETGVSLNIPEGYEVLLYPRSSISKYDLVLCNSVGVVDQSYNKPLLMRFKVTFDFDCASLMGDDLKTYDNTNRTLPHVRYATIYKVGDKIGQMIMQKKLDYTLKQTEKIVDSGRGAFGSTDYKQHYKSGSILSDYGDIPDGGLLDSAKNLEWKTNG